EQTALLRDRGKLTAFAAGAGHPPPASTHPPPPAREEPAPPPLEHHHFLTNPRDRGLPGRAPCRAHRGPSGSSVFGFFPAAAPIRRSRSRRRPSATPSAAGRPATSRSTATCLSRPGTRPRR